MKQLKNIIIKRLIALWAKIEREDPEKYQKLQKLVGNVIKLGAVEDPKNRDKLMDLARFATTQRNSTSMKDYVDNMRKGQTQVRLAFASCSCSN